MEGDKVVGLKLSEIQKKPDQVKLLFENTKTRRRYMMTFKGILFETTGSTLNRVVKNIRFESTVGFRAMSELRQLNRDPHNYGQVFIQMEGSGDNDKRELLGAYRNFSIAPARSRPVKRKSALLSRAKARRNSNRK